MPVPDFAQNIQISFLDSAARAHAQAKPNDKPNPDNLTFDDLVDIVNPLQHFPVVSTLYRKFSGDQIRPLPKIAGDTLYGGLTGLASSVADYAFERLTGKNLGDTFLALVTGDDGTPARAPAVASSVPATLQDKAKSVPYAAVGADAPKLAPQPSAAEPASTALSQASVDALMTSLNQNGIDKDLGIRALNAYRWMYTSDSASADASHQLH